MAEKICSKCGISYSARKRKCDSCGAPLSPVPLKIDNVSEGNQPSAASAPKVKNAPKYRLPDTTASSCAKRFILHTLLSLIGFGVAFILGGLVIEVLEELFAPALSLATVKHTTIFMSCAAFVVALVCGLVGPIAVHDFSKENSYKIVRARPRPFYICSLLYVLIAVSSLVYHIILRTRYSSEISAITDESAILSLSLSFAGIIYYLTYTIFTILHIKGAVCSSCGHISCLVKIGESSHTKTEDIETRERTYGGQSYDVYTSGGTYVGTATGPDTTVTENRTVTTESWSDYFECAHCKHRSAAVASKKEKGRWHY